MAMRPSPAMVIVSVLFIVIFGPTQSQNSSVNACVVRCVTLVADFQGEERLFGSLLFTMPRSRGIPRRGGRSGTRVGPDPENLHPVSPMASVPPSSPSSEQESLAPQGTYQTFRLRFPSRLIRPEVVVNLSVYISEEEPDDPSSTSHASASPQDNDILLGDMNGLVFRAHRIEEGQGQGIPVQNALVREVPAQGASVQEILPPSNYAMKRDARNDRPQLGLGEPILDKEGFVIWLDSPSPGKEMQSASSN